MNILPIIILSYQQCVYDFLLFSFFTKLVTYFLQKTAFPAGFYVVFVMKGDDWDCTGKRENIEKDRRKSFTFSISPSITYHKYIIATVGAFVVFILFYIFSIVVSVVYFIK